ncbi:hypothetical protein BC940DRAFT_279736 [Gongronella butleri]|nr:hypothetical protein BC940DRAFT_279736 [Gongronella butleri]
MQSQYTQNYSSYALFDLTEGKDVFDGTAGFFHMPITSATSSAATAAPLQGGFFQSPAPTAAVLSPMINTPFLESDETISPTCFSPFQTSPLMASPHFSCDVPVAPYIKQEQSTVDMGLLTPQQPLSSMFSTDPKDLLIGNNNHNNNNKEGTSSAASSPSTPGHPTPQIEPLFMPIGHDGAAWHVEGGYHDASFARKMHLFPTQLEEVADDQGQQRQTSNDNNKGNSTNSNGNDNGGNGKLPQQQQNEQQSALRRRDSSTDSQSSESGRHPDRRRVGKNPEEKRFSCPICRRMFSRRYNLNTHIRTHNNNRIKSFNCHVCPAAFDRKHDRDRHLQSVHLGNRSFVCEKCNSAFCRRDALARHTLKAHK